MSGGDYSESGYSYRVVARWATVTQTVRRTIKVSLIGKGEEGIITFQDAFTDPETCQRNCT